MTSPDLRPEDLQITELVVPPAKRDDHEAIGAL